MRCLAQVYCRCVICLLYFAFAAAACCFLLLAAAALPLAAARCRSLASPSPAGAGRLPLLASACLLLRALLVVLAFLLVSRLHCSLPPLGSLWFVLRGRPCALVVGSVDVIDVVTTNLLVVDVLVDVVVHVVVCYIFVLMLTTL